MKWAAAGVLALGLTVSACSGGTDVTPTPTSAPPALTISPPNAPYTPAPTAPLLQELPTEDELVNIMSDCLNDGPDEAAEAAAEFATCAESDAYLIAASSATGDPAVVLIDFRTTAHCFGTTSFIAWRDTAWHVQSAEDLLPNVSPGVQDPGTLITASPHSKYGDRDRARTVIQSDGTYLGIIQANAECGSGAPDEGYLLLAIDDGEWRLKWDSQSDVRTSFGYPAMYFIGPGIDNLHIEGDSFTRQDDRRAIFRESKLGPHRLFEQEWVRQGDEYILESEIELPTPYALLVDFVYGLSHGASSGTQDMVTDPSLIQKALDLGLAQDPIGQEWRGLCGDGEPLGGPPCTVSPSEDGAVWIVEMIQSGGKWKVDDIYCTINC